MSARTTGTCTTCKREHPLDDGRHLARHQRLPGSANLNFACSGSGVLCAEAKDENARKSLARIDRLRADAQVAHDAIATGRPFPEHLLITLRKAALTEYRLKHPRVRTRRLWFLVGRTKRTAWRSPKADVYCTLCRELLIGGAERGRDYTNRTSEHTTLCALARLAGLAEYVSPPALRMPADARPEAP